ncbi:hypothetical protein L7F22_031280 [Adiantum nelumboides]|nr:hypothetical protein [Adiantum nelumboides]
MMTLERSPSHSWWWNSHNSPKNSKWLQSNLQELDEKVKEMLKLIEEDADSFAKRAEMYYQKRPELVNLVEEFYRAYRSLAERYNYLAGNIRQNIPKALQDQFGLSCDSPKSTGYTGRQHHYSPLRRSNQMFDNLLKKVSQAEDERKESCPIDKVQAPECTTSEENDQFNSSFVEHPNRSNHVDGTLELSTREDIVPSKEFSSYAEADNFTPLEKLQQEIENLEMENRLLIDANKKVLELNSVLEKKVEALEDHLRSMDSEVGLCAKEVGGLNHREVEGVNGRCSNTTVVGNGPCHEDDYENAICFGGLGMDFNASGDSGSTNNHDIDGCKKKANSLNVDRQTFACTSTRSLNVLEENEVLKQALSERGEEKREAIRQLCMSIDVLKHQNKRLLVQLASNKKRLQCQHPAWLSFLCLGDSES